MDVTPGGGTGQVDNCRKYIQYTKRKYMYTIHSTPLWDADDAMRQLAEKTPPRHALPAAVRTDARAVRRHRHTVIGLGLAGLLVAGYFVVADSVPGRQLGAPEVPEVAKVPEVPEVPYDIPSEFVVGEWEDAVGSWTQRIRIVEWGGYLCREVHYPGGQVDRDIVKEIAPEATEERRFENPSVRNGQIYAITRHGHLAIYDADGFVAMAINVTTKGEVQ